MSQHCFYCGKHATKLCDGKTETGTCDRPMCDGCVARQRTYLACARGGKGKNRSYLGTIDYCRDCAAKVSGVSLVDDLVHRIEGGQSDAT